MLYDEYITVFSCVWSDISDQCWEKCVTVFPSREGVGQVVLFLSSALIGSVNCVFVARVECFSKSVGKT